MFLCQIGDKTLTIAPWFSVCLVLFQKSC